MTTPGAHDHLLSRYNLKYTLSPDWKVLLTAPCRRLWVGYTAVPWEKHAARLIEEEALDDATQHESHG